MVYNNKVLQRKVWNDLEKNKLRVENLRKQILFV